MEIIPQVCGNGIGAWATEIEKETTKLFADGRYGIE